MNKQISKQMTESKQFGFEQTKCIYEITNHTLSTKFEVLESLYLQLHKRSHCSEKGFTSVLNFFTQKTLIAKEDFRKLSKISPIHLGYTESKLPEDLNSLIPQKDLKIEGNYVEYMPEFFKTLQQFDIIQKENLKSYQDLIQFLQKNLLKKFAKNQQDFIVLNKQRAELKRLRKDVLESWSQEQAVYRDFIYIFSQNSGENESSKDTFKTTLILHNIFHRHHTLLKKWGVKVVNYYNLLLSFETNRQNLLAQAFADYAKFQTKCGNISKKEVAFYKTIKENMLQVPIDFFYSLQMLLDQSNLQDISIISNTLNEKASSEILLKFIMQPVLKQIDESTFLVEKFPIMIKRGIIFKASKECFLAITIDDFIIIWGQGGESEQEKSIEIIKQMKIQSLKITKLTGLKLQLVSTKSGLLYSRSDQIAFEMKNKSDLKQLQQFVERTRELQ